MRASGLDHHRHRHHHHHHHHLQGELHAVDGVFGSSVAAGGPVEVDLGQRVHLAALPDPRHVHSALRRQPHCADRSRQKPFGLAVPTDQGRSFSSWLYRQIKAEAFQVGCADISEEKKTFMLAVQKDQSRGF